MVRLVERFALNGGFFKMSKFVYAKVLAILALVALVQPVKPNSETVRTPIAQMGDLQSGVVPQHHVFFDLHGVIYEKSVPGIMKVVAHNIFWKYPKKWDLWKNLVIACVNPIALHRNIKWARSFSKVADTVFDKLCERYKGLEEHKELFMDLAVEIQHPIFETMVALRAMHKNPNITCYLLSNIGVRSLLKIREKHPEIWATFEDAQGGDSRMVYGDKFGVDADGRDYCKPRPEAFERTRELFKGVAGTKWFVDDRTKNLTPASKCDFNTIHFTNGPDFLRQLEEGEVLTSREIEAAKAEVSAKGYKCLGEES